MNQKPVVVVNVADSQTKQEVPQTGYTSPEMFQVGETVDLIQGAQWRGPLDHPSSWPIWPL